MDDWRGRAACRDENPELFFPIGDGAAAQEQVARAKVVCGRCPVRQQCLDFALSTGQDAGIWGGLTAAERRLVRRDRLSTGSEAESSTIDPSRASGSRVASGCLAVGEQRSS
jgi:WhiB family transcriptional regulator, redox-sensing transcriptional regulator